MPYTYNNAPPAVMKLSKEAKKIWISAFNTAYKNYKGDDATASTVAWAALKKSGYRKNKDGKWVKN